MHIRTVKIIGLGAALVVAALIMVSREQVGRAQAEQQCSCLDVNFQLTPGMLPGWGNPGVKTSTHGQMTFLTTLVTVKSSVTCAKDQQKASCQADLALQAVPTFNPAALHSGFTPVSQTVPCKVKPCDGEAHDSRIKFTYWAVFEGSNVKVAGDITFTMTFAQGENAGQCTKVTGKNPWTMKLVLKESKLDEEDSDYDGDQTVNKDDKNPWDPSQP